MTVTIGILSVSDWREYKEFRLQALQRDKQAFGASYNNLAKKPDGFWKEQLGADKYKRVLFAKTKSEIIGMIQIKLSKYKKLKHIARISSFYVDSDYRGKGIGKKLFQHAFDEIAKYKEIEKAKLTVNTEQTTAINLYKAFGFKEAGKLKKEFKIGETYFDVFVMEKLL